MKGLSPVRTARVIAGIFAVFGGILLAISAVLLKFLGLLPMAQGMIRNGLALYNNFSGRLAVSNIAGHKELLDQLKNIKQLLPDEAFVGTAHGALVVLLVVSLILLVIAVVGLIKPTLMISLMLKVKLLKTIDENGSGEEDKGFAELIEQLGNVQLKTLAIPGAIVAGIFVLILGIYGVTKLVATPPEKLVLDLEQKSVEYISFQKAFFGKNKKVGSAKDLELPEQTVSDVFEYNIKGNQFIATNRVDLNGCAAGNVWTISSKADGLFTKELKLYRKAPQDTNCVKLLPDFRNVGRKR